jgi:radical SAM enzyme (TIGR01210 family)
MTGDDAWRNPFLSRVALALRRGRPPFPVGVRWTLQTEVVDARPFVRLWFLTRGCSKDLQGACTMCNYGCGPEVTGEDMVAAVAEGLAATDHRGTLLVSPSGSMFDGREVPVPARRAILDLVAGSDFDDVICETRAETVTEELADELAAFQRRRPLTVEMGLESAEPRVLRWCVNKLLAPGAYEQAMARLAARDLPFTTNVCLGAAFLTEAEAIADAVASVGWLADKGAGSTVLFPLLIRDWTVLAHLYRLGRYCPVSLWALVETLMRLGPVAASGVTIAWYRDYAADDISSSGMRVLAAPTTCPRCRPEVVATLDNYRATRNFALIRFLDRHPCSCHAAWRERLAVPAAWDFMARLPEEYEQLGVDVLGEAWWQRHGNTVLADLDVEAALA